ncbi:uncharacterized protein LOC121467677 [Drosophila elegans]|uniref:uncharacterized protein LOC121467677 n=1 Tax=Drosophila elegans TaxID=30023 RepID=UPI001BC83B58|nr:uncharacterized protein LOC121467677 [Drosophila elegans]
MSVTATPSTSSVWVHDLKKNIPSTGILLYKRAPKANSPGHIYSTKLLIADNHRPINPITQSGIITIVRSCHTKQRLYKRRHSPRPVTCVPTTLGKTTNRRNTRKIQVVRSSKNDPEHYEPDVLDRRNADAKQYTWPQRIIVTKQYTWPKRIIDSKQCTQRPHDVNNTRYTQPPRISNAKQFLERLRGASSKQCNIRPFRSADPAHKAVRYSTSCNILGPSAVPISPSRTTLDPSAASISTSSTTFGPSAAPTPRSKQYHARYNYS